MHTLIDPELKLGGENCSDINTELYEGLSTLIDCETEILILSDFFAKVDELYSKFIK